HRAKSLWHNASRAARGMLDEVREPQPECPMRRSALVLCAAVAAACYTNSYPSSPAPTPLPAPTNVFYSLPPSGDPLIPQGLLLEWDTSPDWGTVGYKCYSGSSPANAWGLRATTTSRRSSKRAFPICSTP